MWSSVAATICRRGVSVTPQRRILQSAPFIIRIRARLLGFKSLPPHPGLLILLQLGKIFGVEQLPTEPQTLDFLVKDTIYNRQLKVIQTAYESKELRIFRGSEIRSYRFRLPAPVLVHQGGKGRPRGMMVIRLSTGFGGAVIAGMNPPQVSPRSFLVVSPFSHSSSRVRVGLTNANS